MTAAELQSIELPSHFAQIQLSGLKDIVDHHIEGGRVVQFDGRAVERIDGAAVQFLLAVSQHQTKDDQPTVVLVNANEVILKALADMGMVNLIKTDPEYNTEFDLASI